MADFDTDIMLTSFVPLQMGLLSKSLFANTTGKRPNIFMYHHVSCQIVRCLATNLAILEDPIACFIVADDVHAVDQFSFL